ncbi:hypothetical protein [Streptomyces pinistramenti]|uniref:hypothetical protein n=1 Tax=Streptomyces pinistramenti TaxID=2884812 RepID=UPI001D0924EE|nr:hypothetical protein [Streptomyces pinistramenti]MCB5908649.1 hypothetical protein [Streptomyces pinistramenti]
MPPLAPAPLSAPVPPSGPVPLPPPAPDAGPLPRQQPAAQPQPGPAPQPAPQPPAGQPATVAERTMHAAGLVPLVACPGAYEPWPCRCTHCGREVTPTYRQVRDEGLGCACRGPRRRRPPRKR